MCSSACFREISSLLATNVALILCALECSLNSTTVLRLHSRLIEWKEVPWPISRITSLKIAARTRSNHSITGVMLAGSCSD